MDANSSSSSEILQLEEDSSSSSSLTFFHFVVNGLLLTSVSLMGLVCNCLSVVVLLRPRMRQSSFNRFLTTLACFDILYLAASVMIFGLPEASETFRKEVFPAIVTNTYGFAHIGRVGSVFLTAAVTVERYYAIVHPFRHFEWKSILLVSASFFSVAYNVPRFFEVRFDPTTNSTVQSELRKSPLYITVYMFWSKFLLIELFPYLIIIVLNASIVRSIRASKTFQRTCRTEAAEAAEAAAAAAAAVAAGQPTDIVESIFIENRTEENTNWTEVEETATAAAATAASPKPNSKENIEFDEYDLGRRRRCSPRTQQEAATAAASEPPTPVTCSNKEIRLATVLVTISALFIGCQSIKIIPDLYEVFFCLLVPPERSSSSSSPSSSSSSESCETSSFIEIVISLSHLLLAINSSANFVIYVWRAEKVKRYTRGQETLRDPIMEDTVSSVFKSVVI